MFSNYSKYEMNITWQWLVNPLSASNLIKVKLQNRTSSFLCLENRSSLSTSFGMSNAIGDSSEGFAGEDVVSETNHRDEYQAIAPQVQDGLYLVPRVIE